MAFIRLDQSLYTGQPMVNGEAVSRDAFEAYWNGIFADDPVMQQIFKEQQQRSGTRLTGYQQYVHGRFRNSAAGRRGEVVASIGGEERPLEEAATQRALELGWRPPDQDWSVDIFEGGFRTERANFWSRNEDWLLPSIFAAGAYTSYAASGAQFAGSAAGGGGGATAAGGGGAVPTLTGVAPAGSAVGGTAATGGFLSYVTSPLGLLTIGGIAFDIIGQIRAGNAAKQAAEYNAQVAELQAQDAIDRGREQEQRFRLEVRRTIGTIRAGFSGQNVDVGVGSPVDVEADAAFLGELDALTIRNNAKREAWGFEVQAENFRRSGAAAQSASRWGAAESALSGASLLYGAYRG